MHGAGRPLSGSTATHLDDLADAAERFRLWEADITRWGRVLATVLLAGGRLLTCGNGGSAAEAQHLTAELVGRFRGERRPLSAIPLHADTSSLTAIGNDYGADELFARQVLAHGRPGDVLLCLSTSGESGNVLAAADAARAHGLAVWALTGPAPNTLADRCHEAITVDAKTAATVQEIHLAAIHMLCTVLDETLGVGDR